MVEMKLGRTVRPGKRGESRTPGGWIDMGNSYHVLVTPNVVPNAGRPYA